MIDSKAVKMIKGELLFLSSCRYDTSSSFRKRCSIVAIIICKIILWKQDNTAIFLNYLEVEPDFWDKFDNA